MKKALKAHWPALGFIAVLLMSKMSLAVLTGADWDDPNPPSEVASSPGEPDIQGELTKEVWAPKSDVLRGTAGITGQDPKTIYLSDKPNDSGNKRYGVALTNQDNPFQQSALPPVAEGNAALASFYKSGRTTCTRERFNPNAMTLAAHKWKGETVCVSYPAKGTHMTARINDCGPWEPVKKGKKLVPHRKRAFDLSAGLMRALGGSGIINVEVKRGAC